MPEQAFDLTEHTADGVPVVAVTGEIDLATAPLLRERLEAKLDAGSASVVVDLRNTTFLDSTGLGVLVSALKRCRDAGGDLGLVAVEARILKLFAITGLHDTFSIWSSVDAACAAAPVAGAE